jgi:hypothetical protein
MVFYFYLLPLLNRLTRHSAKSAGCCMAGESLKSQSEELAVSLTCYKSPKGYIQQRMTGLRPGDKALVIDSITYAHGAVGFLAAVAVAGFDDVRPTIAVIGFLQDETVRVAVHLHA